MLHNDNKLYKCIGIGDMMFFKQPVSIGLPLLIQYISDHAETHKPSHVNTRGVHLIVSLMVHYTAWL